MANLGTLDMVGRLLLAAALGAAVGAEREIDGRDAGLRTHLMLSLGAALFGLISVGAWDHFASTTNATNFRVDVTRLASYVPAGIGFLGAGTIVKYAGGVRGLTTAASIWVTSAIGLACGVGFAVPALIATATALVSLVALRPVRTIVRRFTNEHPGSLVVVLSDARAFSDVVRVVQRDSPVTPAAIRGGVGADGERFEVRIDFGRRDAVLLGEVAGQLATLENVAEVHIAPS